MAHLELVVRPQFGPPLVHQNYVTGVDFSPDGRRLLTGAEDKLARVWDLPLDLGKGMPLLRADPALTLGNFDPSLVTARPRTRITGDRGRPIPHWVWEYLCAAFSPDGRYVVTGSYDDSGAVFEVATGRPVGKPLVHDNWVRTVAFAPDNRHVLTGSHDMTARLWDIHSGELAAPILRHAGGVVSSAISPDGTRGLTGSGDRTARLWDLQTGKPIGLPMLHAGEVVSVDFSHDGAFALTAAGNGTEGEVRLGTRPRALPIGPPARHGRAVTSVRFSDDDRSFLTLCDDATARLARAATRRGRRDVGQAVGANDHRPGAGRGQRRLGPARRHVAGAAAHGSWTARSRRTLKGERVESPRGTMTRPQPTKSRVLRSRHSGTWTGSSRPVPTTGRCTPGGRGCFTDRGRTPKRSESSTRPARRADSIPSATGARSGRRT